MEQIERIEIESDSDTENIATIDKNHNIDKTVRCTMAMASTSCTTVPDTTTNSSSYRDEPVKMECETIIIYDSDSEDSQEAATTISECQNDVDAKSDGSSANTTNKDEHEESAPKIQPISTRTRSSRRPNLISYNEDDLGKRRDEPDSSNGVNDFPKAPTKPRFEVDASRIPKNNDQTIFYSNFLYKSMCLLCGCSDKNLAVHYARKHPDTEVFIARLSPMNAERIRNGQDDFVHIDGKIHGFCFFCEDLKTMKSEDWKKHLLSHTGELYWLCSGCQVSMVRKANHGQCAKELVQCIFDVDSSNDNLAGYMCNTCNYLQISKKRLIKHIEAEHDSFDSSYNELYSRVILVKTPTV